MDEPSQREIRWRDYAINAQLYQYYLQITLNVSTMYYAITGAILSFCLTRDIGAYTKWALVLPFVMSLFLAACFFKGSLLMQTFAKNTLDLAKKLQLDAGHDWSVLQFVYLGCAALYFVSALGIAILWAHLKWDFL
jgi:hypothetical protein